ncbi:hypothetical protein MCERE19_04014 [Spirosomataceae bacterium]|jgi:hypothetical protein
MKSLNKKVSSSEILGHFDVEELEERLENRWCTTTVTNTETGESVTTTSKCDEVNV